LATTEALRTRFGGAATPTPASSTVAGSVDEPLRLIGLLRFSGPAAPSFGVLPMVSATTVLAKTKSVSFAPVSAGVPLDRLR
jgi:hypothetical protein